MTGLNGRAWMALATTVTIWAGYLVAVRAAAGSDLTPIDVGALRSMPAALLFLPLTIRRGLFPGGANLADIFFIGIVGGAFFTLFLANGAQFAPVADSGIFTPSMLPVFVAILAVTLLNTKFHWLQYLGLATILFGALVVGGKEALSNTATGAWRGHILFLCASLSWACYTVRFRSSALKATDAAMILVTWSSFVFAVLMLVFGTNIPQTLPHMLLIQLGLGLAAGVVANFTFLYSVRALGAAIPAASAALVPVIAAVGGWYFLAEPIGTLKLLGICIVMAGVLLASGVLTPPKPVVEH